MRAKHYYFAGVAILTVGGWHEGGFTEASVVAGLLLIIFAICAVIAELSER